MQRINPRSDSYEALMWDVITNAHRYIPQPDDRVLDLGAHFGMFSLYCAARGARVSAYEPCRRSFVELMHSSAVAYEIDSGGFIETVNCAVWDREGTFSLALDPETSGRNSLVRLADHPIEAIRCCTLHDALDRYPYWECVKMDIEGAEYQVLTTASPKDDLARIKFLTLELHNDILTREQCKEVDTILLTNFSRVEVLHVKVQGKATDQVSAYYCWR